MRNLPNQLILNSDGSAYHLNLKPDDFENVILLIPDMTWFNLIKAHFDTILFSKTDNLYPSISGIKNGVRITVIVAGIGADNIDIIINELDALVNLNQEDQTPKSVLSQLEIIHLGIAHAIQENLSPGSLVFNSMAVGFDNLMHFYDYDQNLSELTMSQEMMEYLETRSEIMLLPYAAESNMIEKVETDSNLQKCITICSPGFYAPQSRKIRLPEAEPKMIDFIKKFRFEGKAISSYSNDTAPVLGLAKALNHQVSSYSAIFSNILTNDIFEDMEKLKDNLIKIALSKKA